MTWRIDTGDCAQLMAAMPDHSVHAIVTDPPYGINFMGKAWDGAAIAAAAVPGQDHTKTRDRSGSMHAGEYDLSPTANRKFQAWTQAWAREALRVLKPGGHMLVFGSTRTYHRMAAGIEDAGFEIRDTMAWLFGSGFPKSLDVSKAIDKAAGAEREVIGTRPQRAATPNGGAAMNFSAGDVEPLTRPATPEAQAWEGWGTALKPAYEPIVVARKPLAGTVAATVLAHGTGALHIDAARIGTGGQGQWAAPRGGIWKTDSDATAELQENEQGRWPANVALDPEAAAILDAQTGERPSTGAPGRPARGIRDGWDGDGGYGGFAGAGTQGPLYSDSGGASRFFAVFDHAQEDACPIPDSASTADDRSCPPRPSEGSAHVRAAAPASPEDSSPNASPTPSPAPSTSATPSACEQQPASATPPTPPERSPASRPDELTPSVNPANAAGQSPPTDTTTTTTGPSTSDGCADPATSASTPPSAAPGAADLTGDRFRYVAKASTAERNAGLDGFEQRASGTLNLRADAHAERTGQIAAARANVHPTVKPVDVMRWLVRLVTPPGGVVLDPFNGSGTTGCAAVLEGFDYIGLEREPEYVTIAQARISWWARQPKGTPTAQLLDAANAHRKITEHGQDTLDLFGDAA